MLPMDRDKLPRHTATVHHSLPDFARRGRHGWRAVSGACPLFTVAAILFLRVRPASGPVTVAGIAVKPMVANLCGAFTSQTVVSAAPCFLDIRPSVFPAFQISLAIVRLRCSMIEALSLLQGTRTTRITLLGHIVACSRTRIAFIGKVVPRSPKDAILAAVRFTSKFACRVAANSSLTSVSSL